MPQGEKHFRSFSCVLPEVSETSLSNSKKALPIIVGVGLAPQPFSCPDTHLGGTAHSPSCFDGLVRICHLLHSPSRPLRTIIWCSKSSFVVSRHSMV